MMSKKKRLLNTLLQKLWFGALTHKWQKPFLSSICEDHVPNEKRTSKKVILSTVQAFEKESSFSA